MRSGKSSSDLVNCMVPGLGFVMDHVVRFFYSLSMLEI